MEKGKHVKDGMYKVDWSADGNHSFMLLLYHEKSINVTDQLSDQEKEMLIEARVWKMLKDCGNPNLVSVKDNMAIFPDHL